MTHCEGKWIYDSLLSDEESDRNENVFIRVAFVIVKIIRIYSFAAKIEKNGRVYSFLVDTRF